MNNKIKKEINIWKALPTLNMQRKCRKLIETYRRG
jgi:hypothetical protein